MNVFIISLCLIILLSPVQFSKVNYRVASNNSGSDRLNSNTLSGNFISNFSEKKVIAGLISSSFLKDSLGDVLHVKNRKRCCTFVTKFDIKKDKIKCRNSCNDSIKKRSGYQQDQQRNSIQKKKSREESNTMQSVGYYSGISVDIGK